MNKLNYDNIEFYKYKDTNYYGSKCGKLLSINWKNSGKTSIMKKSLNGKGYERITFCINGIKKNLSVHRIIAELFCNNTDSKPVVNHKDFDKTNNNFNNLEWLTYKENTQHAIQANRFYYNGGWNKKSRPMLRKK